jgi:glutamyl-tRNA synthetase
MRVRIGPSPTGDPHVGTAYIALFNYVLAKQNGGQFVLRIEDTDRARSHPAFEREIIAALRWLGLDWDEGPDVGGPHGPYRQSERGSLYAEHVATLLASGAAYRCFCTPERLEALRQEQRASKASVQGYDGQCRTIAATAANARSAEPHVVRLRVDKDRTTVVHDRLRGAVEFTNVQVDDQVLFKSDGMPTYHLANVVDDHLMQISHVLRAEEWLSSTPKHVLLYGAFGWQAPEWIHMPLLRNADKSKISKRKNPVSLNYYREAGFLPAALRNYLALMGWTREDGREQFSVDDLIGEFDFSRISLGGPVFDLQKLTWLNGVYLRNEQNFTEHLSRLFAPARLAQIAPLVQERIDKLEDFVAYAGFFFTGDIAYDESATRDMLPKTVPAKDLQRALQEVGEGLDALPEFSVHPIEAVLRGVVATRGFKVRDLFMAVRVAVTGKAATPGLFETMAVLGKERCRRRIRNAIEHLKKVPA